MKTYQLHGPAMPSPQWFSTFRLGRHAATVQKDGSIELDGERLHWPKGEEPLPAGTPVWVWLVRFYVCATVEEVAKEENRRALQREIEAEAYRERLNRIRREAEAFNARIKLPVTWDVGIKDVLSGLSESSWGNGRNRATVQHILLLENLQAGRISRKAQSFLCSSSTKQDGKRWSDQATERWADGVGGNYAPKVTCKSCLRVAQRFMEPVL